LREICGNDRISAGGDCWLISSIVRPPGKGIQFGRPMLTDGRFVPLQCNEGGLNKIRINFQGLYDKGCKAVMNIRRLGRIDLSPVTVILSGWGLFGPSGLGHGRRAQTPRSRGRARQNR
jgi:hypothetical protein